MYKRFKIESSISNLKIVENAIDEVIKDIGIKGENYGKILVSVLEAVNNAIIHGNRYEKEKFVDIEISFKKERLKIKVSDQGKGFLPERIPDPTIQPNLEALNGRGIFLMSRLADKVKYSKKGNTVTMVFKDLKT